MTKSQPINGGVLVEWIFKHVVSSVAEVETSGAFHNRQTAVIFRNILNALGYKQQPTVVKTNNSAVLSFVNNLLR